jgi:hypothetical protein
MGQLEAVQGNDAISAKKAAPETGKGSDDTIGTRKKISRTDKGSKDTIGTRRKVRTRRSSRTK